MKIKIYGESKSGTTYLQSLLEANTDGKILGGSDWDELGWKHGFPETSKVLYIFIFRNVYEWTKSLKADTVDKRFTGIEGRFGNRPDNFQHHWGSWENMYKCRTAKYYSYLGFYTLHNAILLKYEYLREYPEALHRLREYGFYVNDKIKDIKNHSYKPGIKGKDNPAREPLTCSEIKYINSQIDQKIEKFVRNLTIKS